MEVKPMESGNYLVKIPELLPCKDFQCIHGSDTCAIIVLCPEGSFTKNRYGAVCIPNCEDCLKRLEKCQRETTREVIRVWIIDLTAFYVRVGWNVFGLEPRYLTEPTKSSVETSTSVRDAGTP